ncbi:MAG: hypothetical protein QXT00_02175 [Ignisphaera sp.]
MKIIATGLAILLNFACWHPHYNTSTVFTYAVNGVFYSTKPPHNLASLVYWDGKFLGAFPATETARRGGLVCYKNGIVEAGYFTVERGELRWNGTRPNWQEIKWAITGGGLFLLDGKARTAAEVSRLERLSTYITTHKRYSFILVHKDRKRVTIGVATSVPPSALAKRFANTHYALLRLDGGSATWYGYETKLKTGVNNIVGFVRGGDKTNERHEHARSDAKRN